MKVILLHGDDYQKSYERLLKFIDTAINRNWKIKRINSSENIFDELISQSLFKENLFYILEEPEKLSKEKIKWLRENCKNLEGTTVIYSTKTLNKTLIKSLPEFDKEEEFQLPKIIWSFLESIYPGNSKNLLKLFHKMIEHDAVEFIFTLIARQVRDMYFLKVAPESIDYPSWRKGKLMNQMRKYKEGQLEKLIIEISNADIKSKTTSANISELLDFIIVCELQ